jgi:exopolyphosphatase / guanosine-5'-triphosphate,3'-diphosphate pyrophosphatase
VGRRNQGATMSYITETARTYDPDPAHNEQVTALALALFDGLQILHEYGARERHLLEIAGRLHDIGWSRVVTGKHHKLTRDMILELDIPGLSGQDQMICALVARYHTKALPDESRHRRFASLDPRRRELVEWLAGILRIADGLDCTHANAVRRLSCQVGSRAITIRLEVPGDCRTEIEGATQKQDLLVQKAGRKIRFRC